MFLCLVKICNGMMIEISLCLVKHSRKYLSCPEALEKHCVIHLIICKEPAYSDLKVLQSILGPRFQHVAVQKYGVLAEERNSVGFGSTLRMLWPTV